MRYTKSGVQFTSFSFLLVDFISIFVQTEEWELLSASTQIDVETNVEFRHTLLNQNMLVVPVTLSLAVITTFLIRQEHVDLGNN